MSGKAAIISGLALCCLSFGFDRVRFETKTDDAEISVLATVSANRVRTPEQKSVNLSDLGALMQSQDSTDLILKINYTNKMSGKKICVNVHLSKLRQFVKNNPSMLFLADIKSRNIAIVKKYAEDANVVSLKTAPGDNILDSVTVSDK